VLSIVMLVVYVGGTIAFLIQLNRLRSGKVPAKFAADPAGFLQRKHKEFKQCAIMFAVTAPIWLVLGILSLPGAGGIERIVLGAIGFVAAAAVFALRSRLPATIGAQAPPA
jgi:hypothetical protein